MNVYTHNHGKHFEDVEKYGFIVLLFSNSNSQCIVQLSSRNNNNQACTKMSAMMPHQIFSKKNISKSRVKNGNVNINYIFNIDTSIVLTEICYTF